MMEATATLSGKGSRLSVDYPNPFDCPHMTGKRVGNHHECVHDGRPVWVDCQTPFCGEPPTCRFAPIDNSLEAMQRRVDWLAGQE